MRMVVKLAGALLERDEDVKPIARQIAELARAGHELLVIHGGGKIFTATLARMGITSRFINGLRVTDRETRDAAVMVFAGLLNKKLAGAISLAGQPAVGISASDAACFLAEPMQVNEQEGSLGFVGYLTEVNVDFLRSLWSVGAGSRRFLPRLGRRRRALQYQRRSHGRCRRGIYRRRSVDFPHGRRRRA